MNNWVDVGKPLNGTVSFTGSDGRCVSLPIAGQVQHQIVKLSDGRLCEKADWWQIRICGEGVKDFTCKWMKETNVFAIIDHGDGKSSVIRKDRSHAWIKADFGRFWANVSCNLDGELIVQKQHLDYREMADLADLVLECEKAQPRKRIWEDLE